MCKMCQGWSPAVILTTSGSWVTGIAARADSGQEVTAWHVCDVSKPDVCTCMMRLKPATALWQELVDLGQLSRQARLLITGHSLGGALAVLAAFDIKRALSDFRMEMYTYGTPYPANRAFAREFNELLPHTWHIIHDGVSCPVAPFLC